MTFTVTYRGADGAVREERVEAAGRGECLAQCRARGIAPISVAERRSDGKIRRSNHETRRSNGDARLSIRKTQRSLLAAVAVMMVLAGGGAWWWLGRDKARSAPESEAPKKPLIAKEVPPAPNPRAETTNAVQQAVPMPQTTPTTMAPTGNVIKVGFTKQMVTLPDGTRVPANRSKFTNAIERALSTLCNPGGMAIPFSVAMRRFSEDEIRRILNEPMVYDKNDSDDLVERKFAVQQLKDQFREYLNQGKTIPEAIAEIDANIRREGVYMNMARAGLSEALRTGDGELVRAYVAEQNVELEKRGMRKLTVPKRFQIEEEQTNTTEKQEK